MLHKIAFFELNGRKYPAVFSLYVVDLISKKYGSFGAWQLIADDQSNSDSLSTHSLDAVIDIAHALLVSGAEYVNEMHLNQAMDCLVEHGDKVIAPSRKVLALSLSTPEDFEKLQRCMEAAMQAGSAKAIHTVSKAKKKKKHKK